MSLRRNYEKQRFRLRRFTRRAASCCMVLVRRGRLAGQLCRPAPAGSAIPARLAPGDRAQSRRVLGAMVDAVADTPVRTRRVAPSSVSLPTLRAESAVRTVSSARSDSGAATAGASSSAPAAEGGKVISIRVPALDRLRANADDRLAVATLRRVEGGDRVAEG